MKGKIKKLLADKKCGFIMGEDKQDYFFHASVLRNITYDELREGLEVTFVGVGSQRGLRAGEVVANVVQEK